MPRMSALIFLGAQRAAAAKYNGRIPSFIQSSCPWLHFAWREREARNGTKFCPSLMQPDLAEEQGRRSVAPI